MQTRLHTHKGIVVAELEPGTEGPGTKGPGTEGPDTADQVLLGRPQDVLDLLGSFYPQHVDGILVHQANLPADFFELRTRLAGEILQKFVTYGVKLAIVGDFSRYESKALADFIYESNKGRDFFFVGSREEALERLAAAAH